MILRARLALSSLSFVAVLALVSCSSKSDGAAANDAGGGGDDSGITAGDDDDGDDAGDDAGEVDAGPDPLEGCIRDPGAPAQTVDPNAATDPTGGAASFTLDQALAGFPAGSGTLTALITTEKSDIRCTLSETAAPISVANFVGLARGTRPFRPANRGWKVGRFYDGLIWHRVIPGFVIQGGDPLGDGTGGPGYDMVVENQVGEPLGTLAMAAGDAPSGSQFYIVVGKGPAPNYNVFGSCSTEAAIAIASVAVDANDKPKKAVHMKQIEIARCP